MNIICENELGPVASHEPMAVDTVGVDFVVSAVGVGGDELGAGRPGNSSTVSSHAPTMGSQPIAGTSVGGVVA